MTARDGRRRDALVVVFARAPAEGTVKTRLAAAVGDARALELYRWLGARVVRAIADVPARDYDVSVAYTPAAAESEALVRAWLPWADALVPQHDGDLGARMAGAFDDAFRAGYTRVVIVGTDCAAVDAARVTQALDALARGHCVLGPAADGGYYLIGAACALPVFDRMRWSTDAVLAETRARLARAAVRWTELPLERDIDTIDDLAALTALPDAPAWVAAHVRERATDTTTSPAKE